MRSVNTQIRRGFHVSYRAFDANAVIQALANGVLITRLKTLSDGAEPKQAVPPALKVCVTTGLTKKEIEKTGTIIRHAITKVFNKKK